MKAVSNRIFKKSFNQVSLLPKHFKHCYSAMISNCQSSSKCFWSHYPSLPLPLKRWPLRLVMSPQLPCVHLQFPLCTGSSSHPASCHGEDCTQAVSTRWPWPHSFPLPSLSGPTDYKEVGKSLERATCGGKSLVFVVKQIFISLVKFVDWAEPHMSSG